MKVAICDFDESYVENLFTYLLGKCNADFARYTTVEDYEAIEIRSEYDYTIMSDDFLDTIKALEEHPGILLSVKNLIVLSARIDCFDIKEASQIVYKYGPMDGLVNLIGSTRSYTKTRDKSSSTKKWALYSPCHHELTEAYGISLCQMLSENASVLLVDMMRKPLLNELISEGESLVDFVYNLENDNQVSPDYIIKKYQGVEIFPFAFNPLDLSEITGEQWRKILEYINELSYENVVFIFDDLNQGFKEIMSQVDECLFINKKGDYYKYLQQGMKDTVERICNKVSSVELMMSAKNLNEGCYQIEELLTGNLGKYVRAQGYGG